MQRTQGKGHHAFVDTERRTVARSIFSDPDIYRLEQERIFARAWHFMCHDSHIPERGDYFLNYIGEESVVAVRDKGGEIRVVLNSCSHRGNTLCRAESGNTRAFVCTYHGWTFDLEGNLTGVPGFTEHYHRCLDKNALGLMKGRVAVYKGFVFATMDAEAPDLETYLGPTGRMGLDLIAEMGDMAAVPGVQKNRLGCNWKIAAENVHDWYHVGPSHGSAIMAGILRRPDGSQTSSSNQTFSPMAHRVILGDYGHAIGGPRLTPQFWEQIEAQGDALEPFFDERWRHSSAAVEALGEAGRDTRGHPSIFPNLWVSTSGYQISLRHPRGPDCTEVWWFTFLPKRLSEEARTSLMGRAIHMFGPAGLLEQDDGENWEQCTRVTAGPLGRRMPMNYEMDRDHGAFVTPGDGGPSYIDTGLSEHAQMWTYQAWADWLDADSWADLTANRTQLPASVF